MCKYICHAACNMDAIELVLFLDSLTLIEHRLILSSAETFQTANLTSSADSDQIAPIGPPDLGPYCLLLCFN